MLERKSALSVILALVLSSIILLGILSGASSREKFLQSLEDSRKNKEAFYVARNVEETFWQALSESAYFCGPSCEPEDAIALANDNFSRWKEFWEVEGNISFIFASEDPLTGEPLTPSYGTLLVVSAKTPKKSVIFSFSMQGAGALFGRIGNGTTFAVIPAGQERVCEVSLESPGCIWKNS